MTSLKSSTLLFAALAPAPASRDAVSRPLITRVSTPTLKNEMNFSWASISLRAADVDFTRHEEHKHTIAVEREQTGEEARSRCFRCRLQGEHLYVAFANLQMVAMPGNGTLDDLPVHAGIAAKLILFRPFLKVEQIAEKLEGLCLVQQPQSKRVAEMTLKNDRGLFQVCQHPRGIELHSRLAYARKPSSLTAQASGTNAGQCGERLRTSPES